MTKYEAVKYSDITNLNDNEIDQIGKNVYDESKYDSEEDSDDDSNSDSDSDSDSDSSYSINERDQEEISDQTNLVNDSEPAKNLLLHNRVIGVKRSFDLDSLASDNSQEG